MGAVALFTFSMQSLHTLLHERIDDGAVPLFTLSMKETTRIHLPLLHGESEEQRTPSLVSLLGGSNGRRGLHSSLPAWSNERWGASLYCALTFSMKETTRSHRPLFH